MCLHDGNRDIARNFNDATITAVLKIHREPRHCKPSRFKHWPEHAAYKTIIRQEARERGIQ